MHFTTLQMKLALFSFVIIPINLVMEYRLRFLVMEYLTTVEMSENGILSIKKDREIVSRRTN